MHEMSLTERGDEKKGFPRIIGREDRITDEKFINSSSSESQGPFLSPRTKGRGTLEGGKQNEKKQRF